MSQHFNIPRGEDQEKIQNNIHRVHNQADPHGRAGIAGGPQHRSEKNGSRAEQHGTVENQEITGSQILNIRIDLHPYRNPAGKQGRHQRQEQAHKQCHRACLGGGFFGRLRFSRADFSGDVRKKTDADGGNRAADEPADGAGGAYSGCCFCSERTYHGGINILNGGLGELFQHGGPGQRKNSAQHGPVKSAFLLHRLSHSQYCKLCPLYPILLKCSRT